MIRDTSLGIFVFKQRGFIMITRECIVPVQPYELDIIKKVKESGEIFYDHPVRIDNDDEDNDEVIKVHAEHLEDVLGDVLTKFKSLIRLLDEDDWDRFGYLGNVLVNDAQRQLDEIFNILDNKFGRIYCHVVDRKSGFYRPEMIVGITIKSPDTANRSV